MKLKDLALNDRPRERLKNLGPRSLTDVELLAILLGSGTKNYDVLTLASLILKTYKFSDLKDMPSEKLNELPGIKGAKSSILLACFEIARRSLKINEDEVILESSKHIYNYVYNEICYEKIEVVITIMLDCKLKVLKKSVSRSENSHSVELSFKRIIKEALDVKSYALILVHNHPSGDIKPSEADILTTKELQNLLLPLDILLLDHLVVSKDSFYSFSDNGIMKDFVSYNYFGDSFEKNY